MKKMIFTILFTTIAIAHPHAFIEVYITPKIQNNIISNINFIWKIDEMTSSMLIMEFDQDGDGLINTKELAYIKANYFDSLGDYNFYTDIKIKDKTITLKPKNLRVSIKNGKIIYNFDAIVNRNKKDIAIEFYDEDMSVAMVLKKEFIKCNSKFVVKDMDREFYLAYRLEFL
jgi:ABC-type uncharacterized transport system substrate-binding protein